ncbi:MAG: nucleotidyltransferase family protein [Lachnospiraceae bacterium]|nr:nucleotidyltransferase family protein [Lachnospiraceae bacterium]
MKVTGIVAEYNPFHMGHRYQLKEACEHYGSDANVIVMSGDFTQRGAPAVVDKYTRAKIALESGADLVLMLPVTASTATAEHFADAAVSVLQHTDIVDQMLFGAESDDISLFHTVSEVLVNEPETYTSLLKEELKSGVTFPVAREHALKKILDIDEFFLSTPNNILGIEYVKSIKRRNASFAPIAMKRIGASYHDASIPDDVASFASASAIRKVLKKGNPEAIQSILSDVLDSPMLTPLLEQVADNCILDRDDCSLLLHEKLIRTDDYSIYQDCSEELSNRIKNSRDQYLTWGQLNDLLKTKEMTYSRISRVLSHILLDLTKEDEELAKKKDIPYLRVLGFSKKGSALLSELKKKCDIPVIYNPKDAEQVLDKDALYLFQKDIQAADLYRAILTSKTGKLYKTEYTRKFDLVNI